MIKDQIPTNPLESGPTPEQLEVLESALRFAKYLTLHWPQISNEVPPRINYYLSGSLASMLLARSESFTDLDENILPSIQESQTHLLSEPVRKILSTFARPMGDLDYVTLANYKTDPTRLKKGGGGPSFDEVPEDAKKSLKQGDGQVKLMCDPLETYGPMRIARVSVEGTDYYIARPDTLIAYKILHLLQTYESKPEKFNIDFAKLLSAMQKVYSENELIEVTRQVLNDYDYALEASWNHFYKDKGEPPSYERKIPLFITKILSHSSISPEIRNIIQKL